MSVFSSADGTKIAYERVGSGPAVVLVDGAMCYRGAGPLGLLATALRDRFTVYTYDRRGRGESADTAPYEPAREVEDLRQLIQQAGGEAYVYGISSGAALALAAAGPGVTKLALYEPPFAGRDDQYTAKLAGLLEAGRRGDAVALFMTKVGVPEQVIAGMRTQPGWAALEAIAPTLAYDDQILGDGQVPRERAASVSVPTLVLCGSASPDFLQQSAKTTADAIPAAQLKVLEGQTHDVAADALAPVLAGFFAG